MEKIIVISMEDKITRVNIIDGGKGIEIFTISNCDEHQEEISKEDIKGTEEYIEKYFSIVEASTLSFKDEFFRHEPKTDNQKRFKKQLIQAIKSGLSDFRAPRIDASFDENGNIFYKAGMKPVVGKSSKWWEQRAKEFMPEKGSRLGTTNERIVFLALLIKYLIEEKGYTVGNAWAAVCDQSKDLGHYKDSEDAKNELEPTGSRQIGKWCDLANTYKITFDKESGVYPLVGGNYSNEGRNIPLADILRFDYEFSFYNYSTGWIVLSE